MGNLVWHEWGGEYWAGSLTRTRIEEISEEFGWSE